MIKKQKKWLKRILIALAIFFAIMVADLDLTAGRNGK